MMVIKALQRVKKCLMSMIVTLALPSHHNAHAFTVYWKVPKLRAQGTMFGEAMTAYRRIRYFCGRRDRKSIVDGIFFPVQYDMRIHALKIRQHPASPSIGHHVAPKSTVIIFRGVEEVIERCSEVGTITFGPGVPHIGNPRRYSRCNRRMSRATIRLPQPTIAPIIVQERGDPCSPVRIIRTVTMAGDQLSQA